MGFLNLFKGQFIDVIEWADEGMGVLVHRFERHNHEIKMGAKLIVRPGQTAVFVNEGKISDHFGPGTYTLSTKNLPILTTLLSLPYNFESPFKAEVYFIKTSDQLNCLWGTATPIMMRDADFGIVRLRARGNYSFRVGISDEMISRYVGSRAEFRNEDIDAQMRIKVVSTISDALGELKIPALDLAANYDEISDGAQAKLAVTFRNMGLELLSFTIENISLPDEVNAAMDKRAGLGALSGVINDYTRMQAADALRAAADNQGGAGNTMGMLVGAQLGGAVANSAPLSVPPPLPEAVKYFIAVNGAQTGPYPAEQLAALVAQGTLTRESLIWCNGMAGWQKAADLPQLSSLFSSLPPPLPQI